MLADGFDRLTVRRNTFLVAQSGGSSVRTGWSRQYRLEGGRWFAIGFTRTRSSAAGGLECPEVTLAPSEVCLGYTFDQNLVTGAIVESWDLFDTQSEKDRVVTRRRREPAGAREPDPGFRYY